MPARSRTRLGASLVRPFVRCGPLIAIALTLVGCASAILFRAPLRARWHAARLAAADTPAERAALLQALIAADDAARWGVSALLAASAAENRQYGVLVLHHLRSDWARERLLDALRDADPAVRRLAAVGLAIHGDERVVPALRTLYRDSEPGSAAAACLALARLGTPTAVAALTQLASEPADVIRRAAVIDALGEIGAAACVPPLLALLDDERHCDAPAPDEEMAARALAALHAEGRALAASQPISAFRPRTVAERAAAALHRITRRGSPTAWMDLEASARAECRAEWSEWLREHGS